MDIQRPTFATVFLSAALIITLAVVGTALAKDEKENIHELTKETARELCLKCHKSAPAAEPEGATRAVLPNADKFVKDPVAMCVECHEGEEDTHPLDVELNFRVPKDLPLDENGKMSCLTCHFTHGSLTSERPCASSSFMDKLFSRDRLRKSYLLRRDNPKGELCKACHEAPDYKKEDKS